MKIVINACHGGFSINRRAFLKLREMGNEAALAEPDLGEYYEDGSGPRGEFLDSFGREIRRDDPMLIELMESGMDCSGQFAKLRIVEIQDDVEWQIEDYDGAEWIAEVHRVWS